MEIIGTLKIKLAVESGVSKAGKDWKKQTIVLDTNAEYNNLVAISFFGDDKVAMIDGFSEGTDLKVGVNVSSSEWNGRYFNNIDGWRIDAVAQATGSSSSNEDNDEILDSGLPF